MSELRVYRQARELAFPLFVLALVAAWVALVGEPAIDASTVRIMSVVSAVLGVCGMVIVGATYLRPDVMRMAMHRAPGGEE